VKELYVASGMKLTFPDEWDVYQKPVLGNLAPKDVVFVESGATVAVHVHVAEAGPDVSSTTIRTDRALVITRKRSAIRGADPEIELEIKEDKALPSEAASS
jgi:hypothetical protein